jgi:hypothetical protein
MSGQLHAPAALSPGKNSGTHFIGGCVDPRAGLRKFFDPIGTRTPAPLPVQPVASRYTDWAIPTANFNYLNSWFFLGTICMSLAERLKICL